MGDSLFQFSVLTFAAIIAFLHRSWIAHAASHELKYQFHLSKIDVCNFTINLLTVVLFARCSATSFDRSQLQPLFPLLQATPSELFGVVPYLLSFIMGKFNRTILRVEMDLAQYTRCQTEWHWLVWVLFLGDPIKMAEAKVKEDSSPVERALQLRASLLSLLPTLPVLWYEHKSALLISWIFQNMIGRMCASMLNKCNWRKFVTFCIVCSFSQCKMGTEN